MAGGFWDPALRQWETDEAWIGYNNDTSEGPNTAAVDYLPNEVDFTCGASAGFGYIVGGRDAKQGEFPFIAGLGRCGQSKKWRQCNTHVCP